VDVNCLEEQKTVKHSIKSILGKNIINHPFQSLWKIITNRSAGPPKSEQNSINTKEKIRNPECRDNMAKKIQCCNNNARDKSGTAFQMHTIFVSN